MDAAIQTDYVGSQELLNRLIQQHMEQEIRVSKRRHSGVPGVMKHSNNHQLDPDAIYRLSELRSDSQFSDGETLQRTLSNPSKIKGRNRQSQKSFVSFGGVGKSVSEKDSKSDQSLSDKICQVVWSRKASAPFVTPLGHNHYHRRASHHSSVRRGTSPNVAPIRIASFDVNTNPDAFERSQSFKGSSSSGSFKNQSGFRRDPLSRRASGDALEGAEASSYSALSTTMSPLKNKLLLSHGQDCSGGEAISDNNGLVQNEFNSVHSSAAGSGQNLNIGFALAPQPLEKKMCALLASRSGGNPNPQDESLDKMKRQISMSLSIPSRDNSVRSHSSSQSYGSYSGIAAGAAVPLASISGNTKLTAGRNMTARTVGKVKRSGSNPDVSPSSRRMKWRQEEKQMLHKASCKSLAAVGSEQHIKAGESISNLSSFHGHGHNTASSGGNIKSGDKTQSQENERVTWVVHLGFSLLLILAVTCIVVFLRISANTVRKENENLLHSIQPKLNLTTPQPSSSHNSNSQQVQDNSIGIEDKGGTGTGNDKSIVSIQNGQSLTRKNQVSFSSSDNTGVEEKGDEGDQQTSNNNNETTHDIFEVGGEPIISKGDGDETGEGGSGNGDSVRSNNNSNVVINTVNNNDKENPSLKINSIRPKRSRPRSKLDENSGQNLLISVFNENNRVHANNDTPPGLTKTRHLESSLIRFLRNNSGGGQGQSGRSRERRNLEGKSRKL